MNPHETEPDTATSLTVLSWNLAMMERSARAPVHWSTSETEAGVRSTVLANEPDIVTFQELPGLVPYVETHNMIKGNPLTHSGNLATLATHELFEPEPLVAVIKGCGLIAHFPAPALTVINLHLAPGPGAELDRRRQIETLLGATNAKRVLLIGDTNTRVDEIDAITALGLVAPTPPAPTWDSVANRFRDGGAEFRAYFTRPFHTPDLTITALEVLPGPYRHVDQSTDASFHLSDHFPLRVTLAV